MIRTLSIFSIFVIILSGCGTGLNKRKFKVKKIDTKTGKQYVAVANAEGSFKVKSDTFTAQVNTKEESILSTMKDIILLRSIRETEKSLD
jgi:uncharacterized lipoprotein YehR (DUF1307 family)